MSYICSIPPTIISGTGSVNRIGEVCSKFQGKKVLLATDAFLAGEALGKVKNPLESQGLEVIVYDDLKSEPTTRDVKRGLSILSENGCDIVVAFGGGSVIDTSKAIAVSATNPGEIKGYPDAIKNPKIPLIVVPTTAGTGSEATSVMVITDEETKVKMNPKSPLITPEVAIVDPEVMVSMPPLVTAFTGIDALTHAIEAYVSRKTQPITDVLATSAISMIGENLRLAWADGQNLKAREAMAIASLLAGIAFSNASTNMVHGMARPLGVYFNIPHGLSNALLLPKVMSFSLMANPHKFYMIAHEMGAKVEGLSVLEGAKKSVEAVTDLCHDIEIPKIKDLGIDKDKIVKVAEEMARDALESGAIDVNPRRASMEQIVQIYCQLAD